MKSNTENIFNNVTKIHLIGIGGIGMSGIAEYLVKKKFSVTGSDITLTSITRRLQKFGVKISEGHNEKNLSDDVKLVIYSSAVKDDNEELSKARKLNKKLLKRAEALGNIVNDKFVIAISGTHGKTTTTAMIAKVLIDNKFDPTVFVGGNVDFLDGSSSRIGKSEIVIVEADEYDRSFYHLRSNIVVITNIEIDHLDIYKDINDIKNSFKKFIQNSKQNFKVIACGDDENVYSVLKDFKKKTLYGFKESNDFRIAEANHGKKGVNYKINDHDIRLKVLGNHNILNSAASYLIAKELEISDEGFNESIKNFYGVKRRLELKFDNRFKIYDDYAHHPTEIKATLNAIRKINKGRIITVFQPHLYSRTKDFYKEFGQAFDETDVLLLAQIYPAREKEIRGVTSELILKEYNKAGKEGFYIENKEKILDELERIKKDDDVIIFQGAGDITDLCEEFVKRTKMKLNGKVPL